jgi:HK97 gp10 family phage protein
MKKETIDFKNGSLVVYDYSDEVKSAVEQKIEAVLNVIAQQARNYAKDKCPVDTGNLRNSISSAVSSDLIAYIGTDVFYAPYVEMGTKTKSGKTKMKARPYLKPAIKDHQDQYINMMKKYLGEISISGSSEMKYGDDK